MIAVAEKERLSRQIDESYQGNKASRQRVNTRNMLQRRRKLLKLCGILLYKLGYNWTWFWTVCRQDRSCVLI